MVLVLLLGLVLRTCTYRLMMAKMIRAEISYAISMSIVVGTCHVRNTVAIILHEEYLSKDTNMT